MRKVITIIFCIVLVALIYVGTNMASNNTRENAFESKDEKDNQTLDSENTTLPIDKGGGDRWDDQDIYKKHWQDDPIPDNEENPEFEDGEGEKLEEFESEPDET